MRIDSAVGRPYAQQATPFAQGTSRDAAAIESTKALPNATDAAHVQDLDFTSMTRQELFDWMNGQIRSGQMTLDESTSFLGMTVRFDATTRQSVDMATDTTRYDFTERARQGIAGARWFHNEALAERLEWALRRMQQEQGQPLRVDATV
ncbi:MAG: hypothetical protein KF708_19130 [Pirellulales bacterium]|nr:hypothetical protein [Pirellulales bacterium]